MSGPLITPEFLHRRPVEERLVDYNVGLLMVGREAGYEGSLLLLQPGAKIFDTLEQQESSIPSACNAKNRALLDKVYAAADIDLERRFYEKYSEFDAPNVESWDTEITSYLITDSVFVSEIHRVHTTWPNNRTEWFYVAVTSQETAVSVSDAAEAARKLGKASTRKVTSSDFDYGMIKADEPEKTRS